MKKMENVVKEIRIAFTLVGTAITSFLGILALPVYVMIGTNVIDYITGIKAAKYREKEIASKDGIAGIQKKVTMWLLVVVGYFMDVLIFGGLETLNVQLPTNTFVACLVTLWITANEIISILENIKDMGIKIPGFLGKIAENIKVQVEQKGDMK